MKIKETKYFCDKCKKELKQGDTYLIVTIDTHLANHSFNSIEARKEHYHTDCYGEK